MSSAAERDLASGPLADEDARALTRLLQRSLGRGFRLVVIEVATPRLRKRIVEWLRVQIEPLSGDLIDLDVSSLPGENLWSELDERLDHGTVDRQRVVLALHGFQEAARGQLDEKTGLYRQLNVQRDLFVRDLGCFWVVLIHPHGSRKLQDIAPDFCDFASLWIRAPGETSKLGDELGPQISHDVARPLTADLDEPGSDLLRRAAESIATGRYVDARDLLTRFDLDADADNEHQGRALRLRGRLELLRGNADAARRAGEQALAWSVARGERAEAETASALHLLGSVLEAQGEFQEARTSLERALDLKQKLYGTQEHPDVAASLHELGRVLRSLGYVEQSRDVLERALKNHKTSKDVATTLNELAMTMHALGDNDEARRALELTLEIEKQELGTEVHPSVATTLHDLGLVLRSQGDLEAAREFVERAIDIDVEVLGTEIHPGVAAAQHTLASILREQGDLSGAHHLLERVLDVYTHLYGTQRHPDVAGTLHTLAQVMWMQGNLDGARRQFERALEIAIEVVGTQFHPAVATILVSLATLLIDRGELDEAETNLERALDIKARVWGADHFSTCKTEVEFAQLLLDQGEQTRAEALLHHARPILANALGLTDPSVQKADALLAASSRTLSS